MIRFGYAVVLLLALGSGVSSSAQKCPPICAEVVVDAIRVRVDAVTPAEGVIEHSPIDVRFTVTRESPARRLAAVSGNVCPRNQGGPCVPIEGLTVGGVKTGTLRMLAPAAGSTADVQVMFCQPMGPDGICAERAFSSHAMRVAARYEVILENFEILHTKAPTSDTVQISLAAAAGERASSESLLCDIVGPPTYCVRPLKQGDHGDGLHTVRGDIRVGPFDLIPEVDHDLSFMFVVANMGYSYEEAVYAEFMNLMNTFGAGIFAGLGQEGTGFLQEGTEKLQALISRNCDGIVVIDHKTILNETKAGQWASTLDARTRDTGSWSRVSDVYERPNKTSCGDSSKYRVAWRVARTSWRAPTGGAPPMGDVVLPMLSEEQGPRYCPKGSAVGAIRCQGRYCDDLLLTCRTYDWDTPLGHRDADQHRWSGWYSEEGLGLPPLTYPNSPPSGFVTGVDCRGSYCDEIRVDLDATNTPSNDCETLKAISDETAGARCPAGKLVTRIECKGPFCDTLFVQCCR